VQIPALLIWGREDEWLPLEIGYKFRRDLQQLILHIIDDCGHIPEEEFPGKPGS
jgi:pimeloyl-ACP methyl ester carboxylesterase